MQGLHNLHGNFNVPNMPGALGSRSTTMNNIASSGLQQASGNLSTGRFASNNLPVALSQISHSNTHVHSGMASRGGMNVIGNQGYSSSTNGVGGSIPGILPTSAAIGNRTSVPGLGVSPVLGNAGQRITSSMGSIVGGGNIGQNISSGGSITHFQDFVVWNYTPPPSINNSIKMEVGIEDCLHIEFEYNKGKNTVYFTYRLLRKNVEAPPRNSAPTRNSAPPASIVVADKSSAVAPSGDAPKQISAGIQGSQKNNNYFRADGQNTGNFLTVTRWR